MMFVPRYEPICRLMDDSIISLGLFESYERANYEAIIYASETLPEERVKAYQIIKSYINNNAMELKTT